MRKFYLFVTLLVANSISFAAPVIKTTSSGNWSTACIASIKSIKTKTSPASEINIAGIQNKVVLQLTQQLNGNLAIRFLSASGQILDQQNLNNPVSLVVLNSKVTGNNIISISNGQNINTSKQVIL